MELEAQKGGLTAQARSFLPILQKKKSCYGGHVLGNLRSAETLASVSSPPSLGQRNKISSPLTCPLPIPTLPLPIQACDPYPHSGLGPPSFSDIQSVKKAGVLLPEERAFKSCNMGPPFSVQVTRLACV